MNANTSSSSSSSSFKVELSGYGPHGDGPCAYKFEVTASSSDEAIKKALGLFSEENPHAAAWGVFDAKASKTQLYTVTLKIRDSWDKSHEDVFVVECRCASIKEAKEYAYNAYYNDPISPYWSGFVLENNSSHSLRECN